jgi:hypothetical protein
MPIVTDAAVPSRMEFAALPAAHVLSRAPTPVSALT